MNKEQFLATLRRLLRELMPDERERILAYYREMIEDKVESGQTEEEAVQSLGNVYALAQKILVENPNRRPRNTGKIALITVFSILGVCIIASIVIGFGAAHAVQSQLSGAFAASRYSDNYVYKTKTEKSDGVGNVVIHAENKAVVIEPGSAGQIQVNYAEDAYERYDFSTENGTFSVNNTESGRGWTNWSNGWRWWSSNRPTITLMLPKDYTGTILVDTTNSYIKASNFAGLGKLRCETENSAITVNDLSAKDLEFRTKNAAINCTNVTASEKIDAGTTNAQIGLNGIASPDISLQTKNALISGLIRGQEDDYTISAQTTNAISNLKDRAGGKNKLTVETTNAIIDVRFEK